MEVATGAPTSRLLDVTEGYREKVSEGASDCRTQANADLNANSGSENAVSMKAIWPSLLS